ncbi:hypothetical protein RhiJN_01678 [Ceratobasidium sp. AG-Ba]|nr:hypothetical protein RhiJN_01678 [Ceratobasidium sp. AG-Ba]
MFGLGAGSIDAIITTLIGIGVVFLGGVAYVEWYNANVLYKIELAFAPGYNPALELANQPGRHGEVDEDGQRSYPKSNQHMKRKEQEILDSTMEGKEAGRYYLFAGPKGCGKTTMILDAMRKVNADGVTICDAHQDLEVFRLRLGKAINFEYYEDSQTGLFQRRDPREGGPRLDIERALNNLETVAIRRAARTGRPLVFVINDIHLFNNDDNGKQLIVQLQQRAERWAESGVVTMVFNTDDFWPCTVLRQMANRMQTFSIKDLTPNEAFESLKSLRADSIGAEKLESDEILATAADVTGGRLSYISKLARSRDIMQQAKKLKHVERAWILTNIGLIPNFDDDALNEASAYTQKWSSCSWLLLREFVRRRIAQEEAFREKMGAQSSVRTLPMLSIPHYECRRIMTRADFLDGLDSLNIISIDTNHEVWLDSMVTLKAAREIIVEDGFETMLENVLNRIDEIEILTRTREIAFSDSKSGDRVRVTIDKAG